MALVDLSNPEHAKAVAEIRRFCGCPQDCRATGRVKEDMIRLRLTKGRVLDCAVRHLDAGLPIFCQLQTMYFLAPRLGYMIKPLLVGTLPLYFKVALPVPELGETKMWILSTHEHEP